MLAIINYGNYDIDRNYIEYLGNGQCFYKSSQHDECGDPVYLPSGQVGQPLKYYALFNLQNLMFDETVKIIFLFKYAELAEGVGDGLSDEIQLIDELLEAHPYLKGSLVLACTHFPEKIHHDKICNKIQRYLEGCNTRNLGFMYSSICLLSIDDNGISGDNLLRCLGIDIGEFSIKDKYLSSNFIQENKINISFLIMVSVYLLTRDWSDKKTYLQLAFFGFVVALLSSGYQTTKNAMSVNIPKVISRSNELLKKIQCEIQDQTLQIAAASVGYIVSSTEQMSIRINDVLEEAKYLLRTTSENMSTVSKNVLSSIKTFENEVKILSKRADKTAIDISKEIRRVNSAACREARLTGNATRRLIDSSSDSVKHTNKHSNRFFKKATNEITVMSRGMVNAAKNGKFKPEAHASVKICTIL